MTAMMIAIVLGVIQGITEWLPVSSQGVITAFYGLVGEVSFEEAIMFALWLHLGTVISVLIVFRTEFIGIARHIVENPTRPTPIIKYLFVATLTSAVIGFPLLLSLGEVSSRAGALAMGIVGAAMFVTGGLQLRRKNTGTRGPEDITAMDGFIAGIAQGFAVIPGLSRSGLTVAALLARRVETREALVLSFLMSVPASLGAALYSSLDGGMITSTSAVAAMLVASGVGLVTIRALLVVAQRINFSIFVIVTGAAILGVAVWQSLS